MAKNPGIKLTAGSFQAIEKALDSIISKAEEATKKITAMFDIDGTNMKTMHTLKGIHGLLKNINRQMNRAGGGKLGAGGGGGSGAGRNNQSWWSSNLTTGYDKLFRNQQKSAFYRWLNSMAFKTAFGGPAGLTSSLRGNNFLGLNLSKYGPGSTGLMAKYRVFQKPFPGSDRNVFSLGDLAAAGQNISFGAGAAVEGAFRGLAGSAIAVNKTFNGIVSSAVSFFDPILGSLVGSVGDMFIGMLEKMSGAIAGVIGSLTSLATGLVGLGTRAVEAASDLTEATNAARVIAGERATAQMVRYSMGLQRQFGVSQTDSMKIMGRMAGMMRNLGGFTQEEAGATSQQLYRAAVDISSVMNKSVEDVGNQLMSGFAGRLTPLRRSAIGMTAQQLDQQAKARGINRPGVRTDLEARARQFVEEFSRQAGLFTGDLERTQYEFANQRRKFLGQFEALFLTVGRILEPFAKAVLIAANDLMGMVLDSISPFANTIKDNMVEMTVMERFAESIKSFSWYVLFAKNAIIELVKRIWQARGSIMEWATRTARMFANFAIAFLQYSVAVVNAFAGFINRLGLVSAMLGAFETALGSLAGVLNKMSGNTPEGKILGLKDQVDRTRLRMLESAQASRFADPAGSKRLTQDAARLGDLSKRLSDVARTGNRDLITKVFEDLTGEKIDPFGDLAGKAREGADRLERLAAQAEALAKEFVQKPNQQQLDELLKKIQPVESAPNALDPAAKMDNNRLVQYFNPAAFRDAMQESERTPMLDTARNTGDILKLLQQTLKDTLNGKVMRPAPEFNMLAPVTLP